MAKSLVVVDMQVGDAIFLSEGFHAVGDEIASRCVVNGPAVRSTPRVVRYAASNTVSGISSGSVPARNASLAGACRLGARRRGVGGGWLDFRDG